MTEHEKRIREALEAGPVQYACHIDGEVQDSCTFDAGENLHDCTLATRLSDKGLCKTDCAEWKPINAPKSTVEVSATDLRALLADLDEMRGALNRIAAWHEGDEVTPSFDEPHAAAIARNALAGVSDADGAQDAPIPCDVFAGGSLFKKGTPFCELAEHMETEAARLVWAMAHMGMSNDYSRNFTTHVLRVGGIGDIHDCRSFIDAALKGASA